MTSILSRLKSDVEHFFGSGTTAAIEHFAENELDKAVAAAKTTEIGTAVLAAVKAAEAPDKTGPQKLGEAIEAIVPVIVDYAAKGGVSAAVADAEVFARSLIESTLADIKQTGAYQIAKVILERAG